MGDPKEKPVQTYVSAKAEEGTGLVSGKIVIIEINRLIFLRPPFIILTHFCCIS